MADERPSKRLRGTYSRLICLRCRERRIKCQLPQDGNIEPSPQPQPRDKACERCSQQGYECIVRKTTLGRPSRKHQPPNDPITPKDVASDRSPSPEASDLVLLQLNHADNATGERPLNIAEQSSLIGAVGKNFDLTSGLFARDARFGSAIVESRDEKPPSLSAVIDRAFIRRLDEHLVWHRLYMPWLPNLIALYDAAILPHPEGESSTLLLTALLACIALDMPSLGSEPGRKDLRNRLQSIAYHAGQTTLFTLPRHRNTINALTLVHGYRPLALMNTLPAAAHTLSGKLYPTLIDAVQKELRLDQSSERLQDWFSGNDTGSGVQLMMDTIQRCSTLSFKISQDMEEAETSLSLLEDSMAELRKGVNTVAIAIERFYAPAECVFAFHLTRCRADYTLAMWSSTLYWSDLGRLGEGIETYQKLCQSRKIDLERDLTNYFRKRSKFDEAIALSQLANMELHQGPTNIIGLSMLYAIISGVKRISASGKPNKGHVIQLDKFYTDALQQEAGMPITHKSEIREFIDRYGDIHMDGLERRLTDFINAANDVQLQGVRFVGPARDTTSNVLMTCKEIVENNAVRIKLDGELHHRADMQLILFQEAARCLEGMEADGGSPEAVASGSVFSAAAKLIRSLHRIVSRWKRSLIAGTAAPAEERSRKATPLASEDSQQRMSAASLGIREELPSLDDWSNWPSLDTVDLSHLLDFDFASPAE